ncbi:hypothetical protein EfmJHP36_28260 [Enterococcus faecium]|nr:hypothetical protein EfmJHP36_28260 [Enterococcus faecium]
MIKVYYVRSAFSKNIKSDFIDLDRNYWCLLYTWFRTFHDQYIPGIYSLSPYTPEEVIARDYLVQEQPELIINIIDATNLERNLYLTTQLLDLDI